LRPDAKEQSSSASQEFDGLNINANKRKDRQSSNHNMGLQHITSHATAIISSMILTLIMSTTIARQTTTLICFPIVSLSVNANIRNTVAES